MYRPTQLFAILIAVCTLLPACVVYNAAKHEDNICALHHTKMKKTITGTNFGLAEFPYDSLSPNAKRNVNMGCIVSLWPVRRDNFRIYSSHKEKTLNAVSHSRSCIFKS